MASPGRPSSSGGLWGCLFSTVLVVPAFFSGFSITSGCFLGFSLTLTALFVTFLACPRKVTQRRAPGENPLRHARSSAVHFGNSPEQRAGSGAQTVRNA